MGLTRTIREEVFSVSETSNRALKYGSLLVMNAELASFFIAGSVGSYVMLVGAGFLTGLLCWGDVRSTLWHGANAGLIGGFVISIIFAGQYGLLGYMVTPNFLVALTGNINWLYEMTAIVAFLGIIMFVIVDVMLGALAAGLLRSGVDLVAADRQETATPADD
jgi:hypothetical protein